MSDPTHTPLLTVDTNVLVSGGTISTMPPAQIVKAWRDARVDFALCEQILSEVAYVLKEPYFSGRVGWTEKQVKEYVNELREGSLIVDGTTAITISPDLKDNMLFACAVEAQADYIISGDRKHVLPVGSYQGVKVMHPSEFVNTVLIHEKAA